MSRDNILKIGQWLENENENLVAQRSNYEKDPTQGPLKKKGRGFYHLET